MNAHRQAPRLRRFWTALAAAASVASLAACGGDAGSSAIATEVDVPIVADAGVGRFDPSDVTVLVGGTVEWSNESGYAHNVVFDDTNIESSPLFTDGESWSQRFDEPGVYRYICTLHPTMVGTVTVVDATS